MTNDSTKDKIIQAALTLYAELGYNNTSVKAIADKAEVNEVTVFRHFKTKKELYKYAVSFFIDENSILNESMPIYNMSFEEGIKWIGNSYAESCYKYINFYRIQLMNIDKLVTIEKLVLTRCYLGIVKKYLNEKIDTNEYEINKLANLLLQPILGFLTFHVLDEKTFYKKLYDDLVIAHIESFSTHINDNFSFTSDSESDMIK